jgi:hypothetical protein
VGASSVRVSLGQFAGLTVLAVSMAGCSRGPAEHCEERQKLWDHAHAEEDPAFAERARALFVPSCTELLSNPAAKTELACRDACLDAVRRDTVAGSREAKDAYVEFSRCEAVCLGAKPGPQPE